MPSFRHYLFHDETRSWLDTAVWSSCPSASVSDLVRMCFDSDQEKLLVAWSRNQTFILKERLPTKIRTKNLDKLWEHLQSDLSLPQHSLFTTILVDDTAEKATFQPFNHLMVQEYTDQTCRNDVTIALRTRLLKGNSEVLDVGYDMTLIALVGILEALRTESNATKWLRTFAPPSILMPHQEKSSASHYGHWFSHSPTFNEWILNGVETLDRLRIPLETGLDAEITLSTSI
ncbi:hypothetical protein AMATHDRAFT_146666 [Amanita thiersii Skay4041]|uniref:FCP1 homology domain-containing protein n=1 Tax=Amanita thiersii Skay4041 TaxID=703135 RepID=A0A2A9NQ00_9AGAR|nr:hypothetical protein AMATHDRAFT_146666 [Amanita thiersii Skay4041]